MEAGGPIQGGLSAQLWSEARLQVAQALLHPFVVALAHGTLPRESFRHYVAQDAFFLRHFASAYAAAIDKLAAEAASVSPNADSVLQQLLMGVHTELRLHDSFAKQWGVSLAQLAHPSAATLAYTNFLKDVADDPQAGVAEILAAMVPCSRLYAYLGCQLVRACPNMDHPYASWVQLYSGEEYGALPRMKEELMDVIGTSAPYERLRNLYTRAMDLEVDFFTGQPHMPPPRQVSLLVCDFDDTCSHNDTIGTLMNLAVTAAERAAATPEEAAAAKERMQSKVQWLAANYAEKHKALMDEILQPQSGAVRGVTEFDMEILAGFMAKLSEFDINMNQVVMDSGVLAGLDMADVREAGKQLQLQEGCRETLDAAVAAGIPVRVVSVNWSASYVAAALGPNATVAFRPDAPARSKAGILVHANELELASCRADSTDAETAATSAAAAAGTAVEDTGVPVVAPPSLTSGNLVRSVECAMDKGRLFEELLLAEMCGAVDGQQGAASGGASSSGAGSSGGEQRPVAVYIGDSTSDVLPMLAADYGIIVGKNQLLRRVADTFGIQIKPLAAAPLAPSEPSDPDTPPVLYEADNWHQIRAFVLGPERTAPQGGGGAGAARALPAVLTVAGSDSGGGAGIQADLKTFLARGVFGMSAVTALTAQNTAGVQGVHEVPAEFIAAQLDSVLADIGTQALKTGMLPNAEAVSVVASKVRQYGIPNVVVDPVMISTSGHSLAKGGVAEAMARELLPLATVVTPNLAEASTLLGGRSINSLQDMRAAAADLRAAHGPQAVLVKGGHLAAQQVAQGMPAAEVESVDVLYDGGEWVELRAPYVRTGNSHGTGCTLASAIAAELAKGASIREAAAAAKAYLTAALQASQGMALGKGPQRPFNHAAPPPLQPQPVPEQQQQQQQQQPDALPQAGAAQAGPALRNAVDLRTYVVTDPGCNQRTGRSLMGAVAAAVAGGATVVQLREKDTEGADFLAAARAAMQVCRQAGVPLLINDRVDVALAAGADGVHVGQSDLPARVVRRLLGPQGILGVSVKTVEQAVKAQADGADYVGAGAVFPTGTKDSSVIGLDGLAAICSAVDIPVVAIGGITTANAADVIAAGAEGVAVVSAVFAAPDPAEVAAELHEVVDTALAKRSGAVGPEAESDHQEVHEQPVVAAAGAAR